MFVPRSATTVFVPTEPFQPSCLERILHLDSGETRTSVRANKKYHLKRFPKALALAAPQTFEYLDFGGDLQSRQKRRVEFRATRNGMFAGLHFSIVVDLDGQSNLSTCLPELLVIEILQMKNYVFTITYNYNVSSFMSIQNVLNIVVIILARTRMFIFYVSQS